MEQGRQMAEHELCRHVRRVAGGIHFAVDPEAQVAARPRHRDRRAWPVPVEDDLPSDQPRRGHASRAVGNVLHGVEGRAARHDLRVPPRQKEDDASGGDETSAEGAPPPPGDGAEGNREEDSPQHEVRGDACRDRGVDADRGDEQEAGQRRAADRAERVESVEPPHVRSDPHGRARARGHRARERRADQERRPEQGQAAHHDLDGLDEFGRLRVLQGQEEHVRQAFEDEHDERHAETDAGLDGRERRGAGAARSPDVGVDGGAPGDPDQEGHEHRRERIRRAADHEGQRPCPRNLVDHGDGARDCEGRRDQSGVEHPARTARLDVRRVSARIAGRRRAPLPRGSSTPAVPDRHETDRDVRGCRGPEHGPVSPRGQENVPGQRDTHHRPEGVHGVEGSDRSRDLPLVPHQALDQNRQRGPHERGRHQQDGENKDELHEAEGLVGGGQRGMQTEIQT